MEERVRKMTDDSKESLPVIEPEFLGYQLIGDSQFLRFSEQILKTQRKEKDGLSYVGLCVSGQKISDLLQRVQDNFASVSKKVVVMIGTNDLLRGTKVEAMRDGLRRLLKQLRLMTEKIILLTIPPVPRLRKDKNHWIRLKKYNAYIKTRFTSNHIVVDAYAKFVRRRLSKSSSNSSLSLDSSCSSINSSSGRTSPIFNSKWSQLDRKPSLHYSLLGSRDSSNTESSPISKSSRNSVFVQSLHISLLNCEDDDKTFSSLSRRFCPRSTSVQRDVSVIKSSDNVDATSSERAHRRRARSLDPDYSDEGNRLPMAKQKRLSTSRRTIATSTPNSTSSTYLTKKRSCSLTTSTSVTSFRGFNFISNENGMCVKKQRRDSPPKTQEDDDVSKNVQKTPCTDNETELENTDDIRFNYFEKYFSADSRRPDFIHLNYDGLCIIRDLIEGAIDKNGCGVQSSSGAYP